MGASCTTWVSTSEVLPTEIRTTGHGFANAMGRIGGFLSPFIISEGNSLRTIGLVMMFVSLVTTWLASQLPETMGKALGGSKESKSDQLGSSLEKSGYRDEGGLDSHLEMPEIT